MRRAFPAARVAATGRKLAGSIESCVRWFGLIWPIIDENKPQIFEQFDKKSERKIIYLKFERTTKKPEAVLVTAARGTAPAAAASSRVPRARGGCRTATADSPCRMKPPPLRACERRQWPAAVARGRRLSVRLSVL
jgi:hypothetical protein